MSNGGKDRCDYCSRVPSGGHASAPLDDIVEIIVNGLNYEFDDPVNEMAWDDGYVGMTYETLDLLNDLEISDRTEVIEAIDRCIIGSQWCQRNPYAATPTQALESGWAAFCEFVKHRRRFTFLTEDDALLDFHGAGEIPMHKIPSSIAEMIRLSGLRRTLTAGSEWWRLRPHDAGESYSTASHIGPAPDNIAQDGRMTPKGIGAFYGSSCAAGAILEVAGYAGKTKQGSIGRFRTTVPLNIVDLTRLPPVPSLFGGQRHLRAPIAFLHSFTKDATKVSSPMDHQNLEYVPTQVIAETLRYELGVDGILWRSSKDQSYTSCVLFVSNDEVADKGLEQSNTKMVLDPATVRHIESLDSDAI